MKKYLNIKRAIAFGLSVSLLCSTTSMAAGNAAEDMNAAEIGTAATEERTTIISDDGNILEFKTYDAGNGTIIMDYYYNGALVNTYDLTGSKNTISVTCTDGENYTLDKAIDIAQESNINVVYEDGKFVEVPAAAASVSSSSRNLGVFRYNETSSLSLPYNNISIATTNAKNTKHRVISPKDQEYADLLAQVSSEIISVALSGVSISGGVATMIAASLLESMIAAAGGKIIGDLVTVALSDSYDAVKLTFQVTAMFGYAGSVTKYKSYYSGAAEYVAYDGENYSDSYYSGYNQYSWNTTDFAIITWNDTAKKNLGISYPGLERIIVNDPAD